MTNSSVSSYDDLQPAPSGKGLSHALRHDPLVQVMFFSLLLLGGDKIALTFGGLTFRLVFPLLMGAVALLYLKLEKRISFDRTLALLFATLAVVGAASVINSQAPVKSIGYTIWVLFDFLIVISVCYNFAKLYDLDVTLSLWLLVFRVHAVLALAEFAYYLSKHLASRPHLWFYEPSYLAVFMTGYFGVALYLTLQVGRKYLLDIFLAGFGGLVMASATAVFGFLFATLLTMLVVRQRLKLLLWTTAVVGTSVGVMFAFFQGTVYFHLVIGFLLNADGLEAILARGGNRWIRVLIGWDAFLHHPWLGIGIGGDEAYMQTSEYPQEVIRLIRPWTDVRVGDPFCNVFIEVLGTMGIIGFTPFVTIIGYAAWRMTGWKQPVKPTPETRAFLLAFFCTLLALQLDGTMLRYYLWAPLGLGLGVLARARADTDTACAAISLAAPTNRL